MKLIVLFTMFLFAVAYSSAQQLPISKQPIMWFRADKSGISNQSWQNYANPAQYNMMLNGSPIADTTTLNYEKAFLCGGNGWFVVPDYLPTRNEKFHVFIVYKAIGSSNEHGLWQLASDSSSNIKLTSKKYKSGRKYIKYNDTTNVTPIINSSNHSWRRKRIDSTMFEHLMFGGVDSFPFNGKIAEIMFFDDNLNKIDIEKIHTYLSFKYGIGIYHLDYVNSNDSIIWKQADNTEFKYDVIGLGRDDSLGIYQNQSGAQGGESSLTLYYNDIQEFNRNNTNIFKNNTYMLWGKTQMDEDEYHLIQNDSDEVELMQCIWRIRIAGKEIREKPVNFRMYSDNTISPYTMALVINQTGEANIDPFNSVVIYADSIDSNHFYYFNDIRLDIDQSGYDSFSFMKAIKPNTHRRGSTSNQSSNSNDLDEYSPKIEVYPNPNAGQFRVEITTPDNNPIIINYYDLSGKQIKKRKLSGQVFYEFEERLNTSGVYMMKVEGQTFVQSFRIVVK